MTAFDSKTMGLRCVTTTRLLLIYFSSLNGTRESMQINSRLATPGHSTPPLPHRPSLAPAISLCRLYARPTGATGSPMVEILLFLSACVCAPPYLCPISTPPGVAATSLRWPRHGDAGRTATAPWRACALPKTKVGRGGGGDYVRSSPSRANSSYGVFCKKNIWRPPRKAVRMSCVSRGCLRPIL